MQLKQEIIAYGAAAEPEFRLGPWAAARSRARHTYYSIRDRQRWRRNDLSLLDHRNYQDPTTLNRGDQAIVDAVLVKLHQRDANLAFRRVNWEKLDSVPPSAAMVTVCGGGYLFVDKQSRLAKRIQVDTEMFRNASVPVVLFGVGINQLIQSGRVHPTHLEESAAKTLTSLLERADLISVRDWNTHRALVPYTDKDVHMVGDPALYLAPARSAKRSSRKTLRVGVNLPFHGPISSGHLRRNLTLYVGLLKRIQRAYGCEFFFMVHYATETLVAKLLQDAGISMTVVAGSPRQLVDAYAELDLHIGGMLHSCILASSAGTPCIGLAYDVKHAGFFEVMELPAHCVSAVDFDADLVFETFSTMFSSQQAIREQMLQRRLELESKFDYFVDLSLDLLPTAQGLFA